MNAEETPSFRVGQPAAWTFHRASARWIYNAIEPPELRPPQPSKEDVEAPLVPLPEPLALDSPVGDLLRARVSCRTYAPTSVRLDELATLLWATYGIVGRTEFGALELLERTVPSGGGLYPLEVYVLVRRVEGLAPGVHHYVPLHHGLELVRDEALPVSFTTYLFMGQPYAAEAAAVVVITAVPARSLWKYGDRGYRYLLLEAGHAVQNFNLAAVALGLGSCNLGGFFDDELAAVVRADVEAEVPLYAVSVGPPGAESRSEQRAVDR